MNYFRNILFGIFLLSFLACSSSNEDTTSKNYEKFQQATKEKIDRMEVKLDELGKKVASQSGEAKKDLQETYDNLLNDKKNLANKLDEASEYSEEKWEQAKENIEEMADSLENSIEQAFNG